MSRMLVVLSVLIMFSASVSAEDWPKWRGVRGDGTWNAPKLPAQWPADGLPVVWKQAIGGGYAGISVVGSRLYTMDLEEPIPPAPKGKSDANPDGTERIRCYQVSDGKLLWSHDYRVKYGGLGGYGNGPRCTPTVHDGKVYTLGAVGHVFCLHAETGKVIWSKDMVKDAKARIPEWGFAASPVIDEDRVLIHVGAEPNGSLIALDRNTGKEIWRAISDPAGYCTPIVINPKSGKQVVIWTPLNIHGVDAIHGKQLWSVPYKVTYGVSITPPIFYDGIVFVTGYWEGSKAIRLGEKPTDAELIWTEEKNLRGLMAQPLYREGHVYSMDRGNGLTCFELKSGKKLWDDENTMTPRGRNPHASFVWLNDQDRILSLNAKGELVLARINPRGYKEESRTKIVQGEVWSHPAFADKFIFLRTDGAEAWRKGPYELRCVKLTKE